MGHDDALSSPATAWSMHFGAISAARPPCAPSPGVDQQPGIASVISTQDPPIDRPPSARQPGGRVQAPGPADAVGCVGGEERGQTSCPQSATSVARPAMPASTSRDMSTRDGVVGFARSNRAGSPDPTPRLSLKRLSACDAKAPLTGPRASGSPRRARSSVGPRPSRCDRASATARSSGRHFTARFGGRLRALR